MENKIKAVQVITEEKADMRIYGRKEMRLPDFFTLKIST